MRRRLLLGLGVGTLLLVGCGGDAGGIGQESAAALQPVVTATKDRLLQGDHEGARVQLSALREKVAALRAAGTLDQADAEGILQAAAEVEAALPAPPPATTTPPTTAAPPTTTAPTTRAPRPRTGGGGDDDDGGGKGGGKGKDD